MVQLLRFFLGVSVVGTINGGQCGWLLLLNFGGRRESFVRTCTCGSLGDIVLLEEVLPDGLAALRIQLWVIEADVDT